MKCSLSLQEVHNVKIKQRRAFMNKTLNLTLISSLILILSSCGTSKSGSSATSNLSSQNQKVLASCAQNTNSQVSVNISAAAYSNGSINPSYVKIKFNSISSTLKQSGYKLIAYKWKVSNNQIVYDNNPLDISTYNLSTKAVTDYAETEKQMSSINTTSGYLIDLNDTTNSYQVLKLIITNSTGTEVISQINMLIPQFAAIPSHYAYNTDGTVRAQNLQDLHPLKNIDTSAWSSANFQQYFSNYCF